jgi:hypothetical protein
VLKIKLGDIVCCTVFIPKEYEDRYRALHDRSMEQMQSKKCAHADIEDALAMKQTVAVVNLLGKRGVAISGGTIPSSIDAKGNLVTSKDNLVTSNFFLSSYTKGGSKNSSTPFALSSQSSISASIQNMDIRKSHNAIVEMAIADFFHCENIPDAVV